MAGWILVALFAVFVLVLVGRARGYARLLGDEHFLELANALSGLSRQALMSSDAAEDQASAPTVHTRQGLVVSYTVTREQDHYVHHASFSCPARMVAGGALEQLATFAVLVLGWPPAATRSWLAGEQPIHHAQARLSQAQHDALGARPLTEFSAATLGPLRAHALELRTQLRGS